MGAAALIAGTALSAYGSYATNAANASAASARAAYDRREADIAGSTGALAFAQAQQQARRNIENRLGASGASGVEGGSPLMADIDQFTQDSIRASMVKIRSEEEQMGDTASADFEDLSASVSRSMGPFGVATAVTGGLARSGALYGGGSSGSRSTPPSSSDSGTGPG